MEKIYNSLLKDYFSGEDVENGFDKVEAELNKKVNGIDLGAGYAIDLDSRCFFKLRRQNYSWKCNFWFFKHNSERCCNSN